MSESLDPLRSDHYASRENVNVDEQHKRVGGPESHSAAGSASPSTRRTAPTREDEGPRSSYYFGPPANDSAFGTPPVGVIGRDKPREIVRVERDYSGGELCQFHPAFPLELEGRISPTTFAETINDINVIIIKAHDPLWTFIDNTVAVLSLYISPWLLGSNYQRQIKKVNARVDEANKRDFNPVGLNLRYPSQTAFLFLELEYF